MLALRPALPEDRVLIWTLHTAAIRRLCSTHYSPAQIEAWAGFLTPERYAAVVVDPHRHVIVATDNTALVGFGQYHPGAAEIEAIYVHPEHVRSGVGKAILQHFERLARGAGVNAMVLTATLNAVPFYQHHGFQLVAFAELDHPSGVRLRCANMSKPLKSAA